MSGGARTPEELEAMLEDAFVVRDQRVVERLFEESAVLVGDGREARGGSEIARMAIATWDRDRTYVADPRRVLRTDDTALVLGPRVVNVAHRGADGDWRFAISLLSFVKPRRRER